MLVAEACHEIIGFVHLDTRTVVADQPSSLYSMFSYNPRPYCCDLAVDAAFRKQGIGHSLMAVCEDICVTTLQRNEIYMRVLKENDAAIRLYQRMGYCMVPVDDDPPRFQVQMMKKDLKPLQLPPQYQ